MNEPHLDTDVLIRFLTGDDLKKQARSAALLEQIERGDLTVAAPLTVFADCVYVLSSPRLYHLPRPQVAALLIPLARLPHIKIRERRALLRALSLYAETRLDFGDCVIAASMIESKSTVLYSYDTDFDKVRGVTRKEP